MTQATPGAGLRLALAGGGTGGHLVPGLHLLEDLAHRGGVLESLAWFTGGRPVEQRVLAGLEERVAPASVSVVPLELEAKGGGAPSRLRQAWRLHPAALSVRRVLRNQRTQVLLGLGGFVCGPSIGGALLARVPRALLEINAHRGSATHLLGRLSQRVFHAWPATVPSTTGERHVLTGAPLGPRFRPSSEDEQTRARQALGLAPERPLLLVLGGSQGAGALNDFVHQFGPGLVDSGASILLQAGPGKLPAQATTNAQRRTIDYLDDVPQALAAASLVLARGGASTLAELAAARVPAWVVPYPHHTDHHQELNARQLGAGTRVIPQEQLGSATAKDLARALGPAGRELRERMAWALGQAAPAGAAARIWQELEALAAS